MTTRTAFRLLLPCLFAAAAAPVARAEAPPSQAPAPAIATAPAAPSDEVLAADLSALLAKLGAHAAPTSHARAQVRAALARILEGPALRATWERKQERWPAIAAQLAARGLPAELGYLAWVESGFRSDAKSPMGSRGVWQFIPATARRYGLTVDEHVDERADFAKETRAATEYLAKLLGEFGKDAPLLAMAAYNAGESRVRRALDEEAAKAGGQKPEHRDFFWLQERKLLPDEASGYVPAILAAALIGEHPERYGLK
jgi:membrane-bound lytic murein transglycosylase D